MRKRFLLVGALATTLTFGGLFTPRLVQASTITTQAEVENNDDSNNDYVLPNGDPFQTKRILKNGKTLEFYDIKADDDSKSLDCKALYNKEEFQLIDYNLKTGYADITNPGYDYKDESTQKFRTRDNPETYFPALTATKKVNDLIQKYKDPNKSTLPSSVDKTSELYLDMKSCADEAIKDCKTDYEKIVTLDKYVHKIISYDLNCKGYSLEKAWTEKKGVCGQISSIMVRLCQIEGISSSYVSSTKHACVFSYDSESKKWILSDPTNYVADWDVYSWANQKVMIFDNNNYLKKDNCYFTLDYDKNNPNQYDNYDTWDEMENWGLNLQGFDSSNGTEFVVPDEIDGIPVTYIKRLDEDATSVKLPSSLTQISAEAFWTMSNLKSLTIDGGAPNLTKIGERTFSGCSSLEELDLSNSKLTSIPDEAFAYCKNLKTIKLPSTITSIGDKAFYNCQSLTNIEGLDKCKLKSIGSEAFYNCKKLEDLDFSQSTFTNVPSKAFYGCSTLAKITLPDTLTTIGGYAFYACYGIPQLDLSNTALTTLENYALYQMRETTKFSLPDSISSIGEHAFSVSTSNGAVPTVLPASLADKVNYVDTSTSPWLNRKVMFTDEDVKTIHFYGNGATSGSTEPMFVSEGSQIAFPSCGFTKTNYIFKEWNTKEDGTGESYKPGTAINTVPEKLYAQWAKTSYKVKLVYTGGTININRADRKDEYTITFTFSNASTSYSLPTTSQVKRTGYKFVAWYDNEEYTGKALTKLTIDNVSDMTLYAKWRVDPNHTHVWKDGVCTICNKTCEHGSYHLEGVKAATCTEEGFSGNKVCDDCGLIVETGHSDPALGHDWSNENGKCTRCEAMHEHSFSKSTIITELTCTQDGEVEYTCSECGFVKTEITKTTGHKWSDWSVDTPSTCTTKGKETRTCKICSKSDSEALPLAPHKPVKEEDKAATCTEDGYVGGEYCSVCKTTIKERTPITATGHQWKDWVIKKKATCTEAGEKVRECSQCSATEPEVIPATGHDPELKNQKKSTCTVKGYSGDEVCKRCGDTIKEGEALPLAPHTPKKEEGVPATCTQDGHEGNTVCEVCGTTLEEGKPISKLGHDWANEKGECTRCGETHTHSYGEGKTITEITCTQDGEIDYTCSECGYVKKEITKATGHQWGEWETTLAQTCTTDGEQVRKCSKCSETETKTLKATGHDTELKNQKESTCTTQGYSGDEVCKTCGKTIKEGKVLPLAQHTPETVGIKPATCQKEGYTGDEKCKVCHATLNKGTTIPKTQHAWNKGVITKAPNYWTTGIKTFTCDNCGATKTVALAKLPMPKAGTKYVVSGNTYVVTRIGAEVRFSKANTKAKAITIPSTIKVKGITYRVTSIGANAFKNCKKLTTVTIGANVKSIAAKAFNNCPNLKKVTLKTVKLSKKTASKKSFSKVNKKMVIKVPKKVKKTYTMIFKDLKVQ